MNKIDYSKAFYLCKKGSELGNLDATNWICNFYENGISLKRIIKKWLNVMKKWPNLAI